MTKATEGHRFEPDYAQAPGETLNEVLRERGMSQAELARRVGLSAKHINQISQGLAAISPDTALRLERVVGVSAHVWISLEAAYQVEQSREEESQRFESDIAWLKQIPTNELVKRRWIDGNVSAIDRLRQVLTFFNVATPEAWKQVWDVPTAYRQSRKHEIDYAALASWLRICERKSEDLDLASFDRDRFRDSLSSIRALTLNPDPQHWLTALIEACSACGVALVVEPEITGARIHGAMRWLASGHPMIALSLRYSWADIFWFSFFHEVGHLLLHDRKRLTFVDLMGSAEPESAMERDADDFASRTLIPKEFDARLRTTRSHQQVIEVARLAGIHPGVIVGRLQHDGTIPHSHLNRLRVRFKFV